VERDSLRARLERLCLGLDCNESQLRQIILLELWLRNRASRTSSPSRMNERFTQKIRMNT